MEIVIRLYDASAIEKIVEAVRPITGVKQLFYKETTTSKLKRLSTDIETIHAMTLLSAKALEKHLRNEPDSIF
ncbi:MAG: hypothetical protein HY738_11165 [Bacteroidia bacterium]|nr:hypothetical protein [Bacteroidia bacterium]